MNDEIWKTIPFEPNYEVSNKGNVRNSETKSVKSQRSNRGGYRRVTLYPSGKTYTTHRLVMLTFKNENVKEQIDHIDGDKTNNTLDNLEWVTSQENQRRRSLNPKNKLSYSGEKNAMSKLTEDQARFIKYDHQYLDDDEMAKLFGIKPEQVRRIRKGDRWKHI